MPDRADLSCTLEQLTGLSAGDIGKAPTSTVEAVIRAWQKPLSSLADDEIGRLIVQRDGFPYILDLVWPKLMEDPLFDRGFYPGDVLSNLIRSDESIWKDRDDYAAALKTLYARALTRPDYETDAFRDSLSLPASDRSH